MCYATKSYRSELKNEAPILAGTGTRKKVVTVGCYHFSFPIAIRKTGLIHLPAQQTPI